jgi:hypothetical protein
VELCSSFCFLSRQEVVVLQAQAPQSARSALNMDLIALVDCSPSIKQYLPVVRVRISHLLLWLRI